MSLDLLFLFITKLKDQVSIFVPVEALCNLTPRQQE